ncbi:hypothetical protein [Vibrio phage VEN]|uniref:Uncharacterized protein n=1 Tax=Vibrio phage VEN TaxID=2059879 RepID=A0A2H5BN39_9CAUD|nr:hypothetical protein HOS56_gp01 [Vibrio phage VEN]AUG87701.1 hypothetical protein [Vibrio phage VEN]
MKHVINCETFSTFIDTIEALVKKGLTFHSNADTLTIELTGGY